MNTQLIKNTILQLGADVCGVADVEKFVEAPIGFHPKDVLTGAKSVVVFGKQFTKGAFLSRSKAPYTVVRNQLIQHVDSIALEASFRIEEKGYIAVTIPSTDPYEYWDVARRHGRGILSLKHSAQLAGLGSIGKNTLLINEKFGNRLWLAAIVTDARLEAGAPTKSFCPEGCSICLRACPQAALDGITIDQRKCREICFTSTEGGGWIIACKECRIKCPFAKV